jgi:acyl-CoA synthetase (AMP-forming)/AMP-acid ligase II
MSGEASRSGAREGALRVTTFNLADLFESVADAIPDREAVVAAERRLRYAELDERATRLANALAARGIGPRDHVGLQLANGSEYLEAMLAAFKLRAVPINVNYRYVEGELRYLFEDARLAALVVHRGFVPRVAAVAPRVPALRTFLVVDDGSGAESALPGGEDYEQALATASPKREFAPRSSDDLYLVYTGGTTGRPKGVVWRHEDIFFASMGGGDPLRTGSPISSPDELVGRITREPVIALAAPPFMHAAAHWLAWNELLSGGTVVTTRAGAFHPAEIWGLVDREQVNLLLIVGDAMAMPLADELAAHRQLYAVAHLFAVVSGGALFSPAAKERLAILLPGRMILDGLGSSETGTLGTEAPGAGATRFRVGPDTAVLDDRLRPVAPGSGVVGRLARRGRIPLGYWSDEEKTRATFVEVDGVRWALPGDLATVEEDGSIRLLGRGSLSINTGGEKVFPEEVEAELKAHPAILDAVVVGVPDPRFGQRVVAVAQTRPGAELDLESLRAFCRGRIAAYKIRRDLVRVGRVERSPAGKADYRWAERVARERLGAR